MVTLQGGSIGSYGDHEVEFAFIEQPHHTYHQVLIPDTMVSRRHAVISFRNARYYLKDLGSSNGTFLIGNDSDGSGIPRISQKMD